MIKKINFSDDATPHFITFTIVGWIDVFSNELYKEKMIESMKYCLKHKGLILHAWIIMTNQVHMIVSTKDAKICDIVRDMKKFTSKKIIALIQENEKENRKNWMLNIFSFTGKGNSSNKDYQFWKQDYHPIELCSSEQIIQKLKYLHEYPVRSGLVWEAKQYKYSSAIDYHTSYKGLIDIDRL
jgi:REP element-mobilizing transposase RayT